MRRIYFYISFGIVILFLIYYFIQYIFNNNVITYDTPVVSEGFTSHIHAIYRPYIRHFNQHYEYFSSQYNTETIYNKLRKWNIF
jgi:hypothetical protein